MERPLSGIRVLDLTRFLSGPYATLLLAEMGAEVIKVEMPGQGDDTRHVAPFKDKVSFYHSAINRSKKSVEIDLKTAEGRQLVHAMILDCDVLVANFRPGAAERMGFGYETLSVLNPKLVYCAISGFGSTGPQRDRAAFDLIVQAESGIMSLNGEPDQAPSKIGVPVADLTSGMFAAHGILAALVRRSRTGLGGLVDVSMFSSMLSLSASQSTRYFITGVSPKRQGSHNPNAAPYGPYPTADGTVLISTFGDKSWEKIVRAMDRPELAGDVRFSTGPARVAHRSECDMLVVEMFSTFSSEDIVQRLGQAGVPCGVIRSLGEALDAERASGSGAIQDVDYSGDTGVIPAVSIPIKFDGEWCPAAPAPALGEHNELLAPYRT
jgi:CoA:oxalate CoA-transferase